MLTTQSFMYPVENMRIVNEHVICTIWRPVESNEDGFLQFTEALSSHLLERISARALNCLADVVVVLDAHGVHHQKHRRQHKQQKHFDGHREHARSARRRRRTGRATARCHRPSSTCLRCPKNACKRIIIRTKSELLTSKCCSAVNYCLTVSTFIV